jgi:hypothetical protein
LERGGRRRGAEVAEVWRGRGRGRGKKVSRCLGVEVSREDGMREEGWRVEVLRVEEGIWAWGIEASRRSREGSRLV